MARKQTATKNQFFAAVPQQPNIRPAFTVEKLSGTLPHRVHIFDKETNRIKSKVIQEPAGFMVKCYKGHSIRARNEEHLRQIGADLRLIPLIDEEGEVKAMMPNIDLQTNSEDDDDIDVIDKE